MARAGKTPIYKVIINGLTFTGRYRKVDDLRKQAIRYGIDASAIIYHGQEAS